ncbi:hypothetical protein [Pseudonocardia dioxanivorans]|uniref:hypothetical protein n=1 Tax=Pseudonocardia dioxanivorans TaxID=240495 RepID=UPI000D02922E|nr:hypothetical protein [Pseudonocardia dioxanivorans]
MGRSPWATARRVDDVSWGRYGPVRVQASAGSRDAAAAVGVALVGVLSSAGPRTVLMGARARRVVDAWADGAGRARFPSL